MYAVKYFFLLLLVGVVILFSIINMSSVPVYYYNTQFEKLSIDVPLVVVALVSVAFGFLVCWFFSLFHNLGRSFAEFKQKRSLKKTGKELNDLKVESAVPKSLE